MISFGVCDAIGSLCFGRLVQYVGHIPFFVLGKIYLWNIFSETQHCYQISLYFFELVTVLHNADI